MATPIEFDSEARQEFDEAFNWYAIRSPTAAAGFAAEVDAAIEKISSDPLRFAKTYAGCQYCMLDRYPYSVIYYHKNRRVTVVAIAHAKRRPGYWKLRLPS
jgi:plasmid stabilization system protein ParE